MSRELPDPHRPRFPWIRSTQLRQNGGLEIAGWHQVDLGTEDGLQVGLDTPQAAQAQVRRQVHEQVDVTVGPGKPS